jgi:hypothetical protein
MTLTEWTEEDGTIYRLNIDGDYDIISPAKNSKVKKSVKKSANTKKGN